MNPWFVTGFSDAEASFSLNINKDIFNKFGLKVQIIFQIGLHKKDKALLEEIQRSFGVGKLYKHGDGGYNFMVRSVKPGPTLLRQSWTGPLEKIFSHFDKYPLITQKRADYLLFKQAGP